MKNLPAIIRARNIMTNLLYDVGDLKAICDILGIRNSINFSQNTLLISHQILNKCISSGEAKYNELLEAIFNHLQIDGKDTQFPTFKELKESRESQEKALKDSNTPNFLVPLAIFLALAIVAIFVYSNFLNSNILKIRRITGEEVVVNFINRLGKQFLIYEDSLFNLETREVILLPRQNYRNNKQKHLNICQIALFLADSVITKIDTAKSSSEVLKEYLREIQDITYFDKVCDRPFEEILRYNYQVELDVEKFPSTFKLRGERQMKLGLRSGDTYYFNRAINEFEKAHDLLESLDGNMTFSKELLGIDRERRQAVTLRNEITLQPEHELVKIPGESNFRAAALSKKDTVTSRFTPTFYIDKYEVSNFQFRQIFKDFSSDVGIEKDTLPVVNISWAQANEYCKARNMRLPTELEWEKAALWNSNNNTLHKFPWGRTKFTAKLAGFSQDSIKTPLRKIQSYKKGKSNYGVYNLFGNVAEWMNLENEGDTTYHIARGGAWIHKLNPTTDPNSFVRISSNRKEFWIGFRCACDANTLPSDIATDFWSDY